MAVSDYDLTLSDAQEATTQGNYTTTKTYLDLGVADVGMGTYRRDLDLDFVVKIVTAVTSAGAATVQFKFQTDTDSAFGSAVDLVDFTAIGKASLVSGYTLRRNLRGMNVERYVRGYITIATADLTAGAWDVFLAPRITAAEATAVN